MPTIAEDSTPQQVFDYVVNHLRTQGSQSIDERTGNCAYRGRDGKSCAIGCLLTDAEYDPNMEGGGISHLVDIILNNTTQLASGFWGLHIELLYPLQSLHDNVDHFEGIYFEERVQRNAERLNLEYKPSTKN